MDKMIPNDILLYLQISALSCIVSERLHSAVNGTGAEPPSQTLSRESKLESSIRFLPSLRAPGKIVEVRRNGGHQENTAH